MLRANLLAVVVTALASFLVPITASDCVSDVYEGNVTQTEDVEHLRDEMDCDGEKTIDVTWFDVQRVSKRIEVSAGKTLTITGESGGPDGFDGIDAEGADGIFLVSNGSLTLKNLLLTGGNSSGTGGAIAIVNGSIVQVSNCKFERNIASISGGAISVSSSSVTLSGRNIFENNQASTDGGGAIDAYKSEIYIHDHSTFEANIASGDGGAINEEDCVTNITSVADFTGNSARSGGAFVSTSGSRLLFVGNVSFSNNSATAGGGAMLITAPYELDLSGSKFNFNKAEFGGAVSLTSTKDETSEFGECYFEENEATDGGALYLYTGAGTAAVKDSNFSKNYARISGGAIFHTGSMSLDNCNFIANEAGDEGLAVISIGLLDSMVDVTFEDNTLHCAAGQYGYMNDTEREGERFDMACARCATGDNVRAEDAKVTDTNRTPVCKPLPPGADTSATGVTLETISLTKGYYRTSNTSIDVRECYHRDACDGGDNAEQYCAEGYKGPYCAVCKDDFSEGISYTCNACSDVSKRSAVTLAVFIALFALLAMGVLLSYLGTGTDEWAEENMAGLNSWQRLSWNCQDFFLKIFPLTAIKIVVVVWQIVSQFAAIAGNVYPQEYEDFLSRLSPIHFDIGLLSSFSCTMTMDFYDRLLLATVSPIAVLGLLMCTYVVANFRNRDSELALRRVKHKHLSAALFVAFFVYSSVSYTVFQTFVCDKMDDENIYLRADYDVKCTTPLHKKYELYATLMILVYPVGIPLVFTYWLARNRGDLIKFGRDDMLQLQPASDLWAAYKPSRYYYEVVECARRITLTGVAVFVLPNSSAQIAVVLLLAVVFLFVSESMCPFEKGVDMGLYRWGNGIILASMYVALLLKVDVSHEKSDTLSAFAAVLIAANICMIMTVFVQSALLVKDWIVAKKRARLGISDVPQAVAVFVLDVRSAGEEEQCTWSTAKDGYGLPVKRASIFPEPGDSPARPAPLKKQSCFRSSSQ